jgi:hypothetical protein
MKYTFLVTLSITTSLFSAAPLFHVYLAEQYIQLCKHYTQKEKNDFLLGTLLPDLKDACPIQRKLIIHPTGITLDTIKVCTDALQAGEYFHCFVDELRRSLVKEWNIYESIRPFSHGYTPTLLKLIEDEIIFDHVEIDIMQALLATAPTKSLPLTVSSDAMERWHTTLVHYFSNRPSILLSELAQHNKGYTKVPASIIKEWALHMPSLARKEHMINYVEKMINAFKTLFSKENA